MAIYFITGNPGKVEEAQWFFPEVQQLYLDLPEIQSLDPRTIIEEKLKKAVEQHSGDFFIEDTSLHFNCLNGFPGPLIKWLLESVGNDGIYKLIQPYKDKTAVARTVVGYARAQQGTVDVKFFEGTLEGTITPPKGALDFGWGPIFQPAGSDKTFGEMTRNEKKQISMRSKAFQQLRKIL